MVWAAVALVSAVMLGAWFGVGLMCLMVAARDADRRKDG